MRIRARAAFVKHQITLSSSALMKSDYPESPAARNNIWESGQSTCGGGEGVTQSSYFVHRLYIVKDLKGFYEMNKQRL